MAQHCTHHGARAPKGICVGACARTWASVMDHVCMVSVRIKSTAAYAPMRAVRTDLDSSANGQTCILRVGVSHTRACAGPCARQQAGCKARIRAAHKRFHALVICRAYNGDAEETSAGQSTGDVRPSDQKGTQTRAGPLVRCCEACHACSPQAHFVCAEKAP